MLSKFLAFLIVLVTTVNTSVAPIYAQSALSKQGVDFYDLGTSSCSQGNGQPTSIDLSTVTWGSGVWTSGSSKFISNYSGPYTLEYWAISVLKNISRKTGVSESTMVTASKVLALITFAKTEGGGYSGHNGTYNPLNKKGVYADIPGANQGNAANDSNSTGYTTFDDGVEAVTRGLFGIYQKRVGGTLLDPNMTPMQFMEAVTGDFYMEGGPTNDRSKLRNRWQDKFPGDLAWATGSITDWIYDPAGYAQNNQIGIGNREKHLQTKLQALNNVKTNYESSAKIQLDYPDRKADTRIAPALQYSSSDMSLFSIDMAAVSCVSNDTSVPTGDQSRYGTTPATGNIITGNLALGAYGKRNIRYDQNDVIFQDGKCTFNGSQPAEAKNGVQQPGSKAIQLLLDSKFGGGTNSIYNCRLARGSSSTVSMHASGRAVDSYHYVTNPDDLRRGNEAMGWLIANAELIGLQLVVFWRLAWTPKQGLRCNTSAFNQRVHSTHLHFDLNWDGALKKTPHFNGQPAGDATVEINQDLCPKLY